VEVDSFSEAKWSAMAVRHSKVIGPKECLPADLLASLQSNGGRCGGGVVEGDERKGESRRIGGFGASI